MSIQTSSSCLCAGAPRIWHLPLAPFSHPAPRASRQRRQQPERRRVFLLFIRAPSDREWKHPRRGDWRQRIRARAVAHPLSLPSAGKEVAVAGSRPPRWRGV
eukprot:353295-Chlamydomonas_euryale.AAC.3